MLSEAYNDHVLQYLHSIRKLPAQLKRRHCHDDFLSPQILPLYLNDLIFISAANKTADASAASSGPGVLKPMRDPDDPLAAGQDDAEAKQLADYFEKLVPQLYVEKYDEKIFFLRNHNYWYQSMQNIKGFRLIPHIAYFNYFSNILRAILILAPF